MKSSPASQSRERLLAVASVTVVQGVLVSDVGLDVVEVVDGSLRCYKRRRSSC